MTPANNNPAPGLLVVEGQNDQHLVLHLCRQATPQLETAFAFHDAKGLTGLLNSITGYVNQQDLPAVGFLVDADSNPLQRWSEVTGRIIAANGQIPIPSSLDEGGTIIAENLQIGSPRIGVWVMPDNVSEGEIEDFVKLMIPAVDLVWPLAQSYINDIPSQDRKFENHKVTKSQVHAWLATRKFPSLMGLAVREGDLETNGQICQKFLAWLARLFG